MMGRLDALFAVSSLAAFRTEYEAAKRSGAWTIRVQQGERWVGFGPRLTSEWREFSAAFDASGALITLFRATELGQDPRKDPRDPPPGTYAATTRMVREITGENRELEVRFAMVDEHGDRMVEFLAYPRVAGRVVIDDAQLITVIGRAGERLRSWYGGHPAMRIDTETHGHDPTFPIERLREIARRRLRRIKLARGYEFSRYFLATDRIEIDVPGGSADRAPTERQVGIPIYRRVEFSQREPRADATITVALDARDGKILGTGIGTGRQGGAGGAIPLPDPITFAGVTGRLEPLAMRSATPPGERVDLPFGRNVFAARFEPGQGTL